MNESREFKRWLMVELEDHPDVRIHTRKEVCGTCDGDGTTWCGRPADDPIIFFQSDMDEMDQDERDEIARGSLNATCPNCNGKNVVDVMDPMRNDEDVRNRWHEWLADAYSDQEVYRQESGFYVR